MCKHPTEPRKIIDDRIYGTLDVETGVFVQFKTPITKDDYEFWQKLKTHTYLGGIRMEYETDNWSFSYRLNEETKIGEITIVSKRPHTYEQWMCYVANIDTVDKFKCWCVAWDKGHKV